MKSLSLTIPGTVRIKKNSKRIFARGRFKTVLPSKAYEAWEAEARRLLWQSAIVPPLTCPVSVEAVFRYKGNRPDLSGAMESIGDCLEGIVFVNDAQIESWDGSRMVHDLAHPRTEIVIRWED